MTASVKNTAGRRRGVEQIIRGRPATDGAGVRLTRVIGTSQLDHLDPFLLFDVFESDDPDDYIAGFPRTRIAVLKRSLICWPARWSTVTVSVTAV